jgi:pimeloyl-ACP methyl ester carboxylesterase
MRILFSLIVIGFFGVFSIEAQALFQDEGGAPLERPQNPQEPYGYSVEDVFIENKSAGLILAGTLTKPAGEMPRAVAILTSGSGPQDRDETLMGHKPFWVIADYLTKQGFAVLRYDDRGVAKSTGDFDAATSLDFVTDINAVVTYLQARDDLPSDKIGLIGHSEGGLLGPMVAAENDDVAFVIMLAGPGIGSADLLAEQMYLVAKVQGGPEDALKAKYETDLKLFNAIGDSDLSIPLSEELLTTLRNSITGGQELPNEAAKAQLEALFARFQSPWFRYFLSHKPAPYLEKVTVPTLAINGTLDLQVAYASNLGGIRAAFEKSNHPDYEIVEMESMNHLFQSTLTGSPLEYATLTETFSPKVLEKMVSWLKERF